MQFNVGRVPFSRAGSYLAISELSGSAPLGAGIYLRTLHGAARRAEICRIEILDADSAQSAKITSEPTQLTMQTAGQSLQWLFVDAATLRCAGSGLGVQLSFPIGLYDHAVQRSGGWQINSFSNRMSYALFADRGSWTVRANTVQGIITAVAQPDVEGVLDIRLCEFVNNWPHQNPTAALIFEIEKQNIAAEFERWQSTLPQVPARYAPARELAAYVLWSAQVAPAGYLQRPALLMSKNWMTNVWSWDHCFNAMALSNGDAALAWDQFMIPFDAQDATGALPDCINDAAIVWNFCKPPIHGWALRWILRNSQMLDNEKLQEIYLPLCRWTEWWFTHRNDRGDGIPQYNHGNDSGWDNSTLFDAGMPMQTPELSAFLVLQMEVLAEIAQRLEKKEEGVSWQQRADKLVHLLIQKFWRGDHFVALRSTDGADVSSATLLLCFPVILGRRLPSHIREHLVAALSSETRYLTTHGLATECLQSPHYAADSYWRGPIWAPVMFLIVEALRDIDEVAFAASLSERFCNAVAAGGMAENFDAVTGAGLRDPAHTWTAAVFLLLASDLSA